MARSGTDLLSAAEVAAFRRDGFVVVRQFFARDEMRRVTGWVDELQAYPEVPGAHMMYFEQSAGEPGRRLLNRIENFAPFHSGLGELVVGRKLIDALTALVGEPALLFKDKINFKLPGGSGFEPHQDAQAGWGEYADFFVTAAIAIDRATIENGCLELARWEHRLELIGDLWAPLDEARLAAIEFVPHPMEPGDAAFFDSYLPHRSAPNATPESRRVLYLTYNRASAGDQRARYYADKRRSYPPDCEREPGRIYEYKV
jgi:hypothetical protein